jgi:hypothetical protein
MIAVSALCVTTLHLTALSKTMIGFARLHRCEVIALPVPGAVRGGSRLVG